MPSKKKGQCAHCGAVGPITNDHVIQESVYGSEPPDNLYTVPACDACNQDSSSDEAYFRFFVSTGLPYEHPVARELTHGAMTRQLGQDARLRAEIEFAWRPATLELGSGLLAPTQSSEFDRTRIDRVFGKMARGVYHVTHKKPMPQDAT
ncbi:MAG: hypothetical protein QGI09_11010, partial [Dehalococcoidia bacterium]|nr:hypothetical protein [Dehalococcoidia bacterium]